MAASIPSTQDYLNSIEAYWKLQKCPEKRRWIDKYSNVLSFNL
jgi:hypothetical protein